MNLGLSDLARAAVGRTLFAPTSLDQALRRMGFVQADPIRAPARAQDLILRHRVKDYRVNELDQRYPELPVEEDVFLNYGFLPREHVALMHPRALRKKWTPAQQRRAADLARFIHARGEAHPDEVEAEFAHGRVTNAWGGSSRATTQLLDAMHFLGLLRVRRRERGVRVFAPPLLPALDLPARARAEQLLQLALSLYAPVDERGLSLLVRFLRGGARHLAAELNAASKVVLSSAPRARVDGRTWYWPEQETPAQCEAPEQVRLLAPFDPLVWDRDRFERLWGWRYRFEAYTPVHKRVRGYYALPLLWRDAVIGWANVTDADTISLGFVAGRPPRERAFARALEEERERLRRFLTSPEKRSP